MPYTNKIVLVMLSGSTFAWPCATTHGHFWVHHFHTHYTCTHGVPSFICRSSTTFSSRPLCLHHRCQFHSTIPQPSHYSFILLILMEFVYGVQFSNWMIWVLLFFVGLNWFGLSFHLGLNFQFLFLKFKKLFCFVFVFKKLILMEVQNYF